MTGPAGSEHLSTARLAAAVFLAAVLTFGVTATFGYTWDDPPLVERVRTSLSRGTLPELFTTSFHVQDVRSARYFRPVMMVSLLGDVLLTGGAPWFSHLVNVVLHGTNSVLVLLLLNFLLGRGTGALAGALIFAVHPVHAEAVAAVSSRMDLMALTLVLPAAILWAAPAENRPGRPLPAWLAVSSLFLLACFTKETAFMLPVVLLGRDAIRWKRPDGHHVTGAVLLAAAAALALLARAAVFAREAAETAGRNVKAGALMPDVDFAATLKILFINMRLASFPFPVRSHWAGTDLGLSMPSFIGAALFLGLAGFYVLRERSLAAFGLLWWAAFTFPVLGVFNLGQVVAAERYAYIPSVGFCVIAGGVVATLVEKPRFQRPARGLALTGLILLATWSVFHVRPWKNEISLYTNVLKSNPSYATAYLNFGVALAREGRYEEALQAYDTALGHVPGWDKALFDRGNLLQRMGRNEEALANYDTLLQADPEDWEAALNRGNALASMGRSGEASRSYEKAAALAPSSGKPLVALALLAALQGDHREAARLFAEAAVREPGLSEAHEGLGDSYTALGRPAEAERAYLQALAASAANARAAVKLGILLLDNGRPASAVPAFKTALATDPSLVPAWAGLITAFRAAGNGYEADRLIRELDTSDRGLAVKVRASVRSAGKSSGPAGNDAR